MGNRPVWSEYDLLKGLLSITDAKISLVFWLPDSWLGEKSSESLMDNNGTVVFVERMCCCCPRKCPLAVATDLGRCLRTRSVVRPGQEIKCPRLIARTRDDTTGLNNVAWRNAARAALVDADLMALETEAGCLGRGAGTGFEAGAGSILVLAPRTRAGIRGGTHLGARGMDHRPLIGLRRPVIIILPSFTILTLNFVKTAIQSSSHSWPMEMRDPVLRPSRTWPLEAVGDSCGANGTWTE